MESEEFISLGGDFKNASPGLDAPNGNDADTVGNEAVKLSEGPTGYDLNRLDDEAEPQDGSARDLNADEASLFTEFGIVSDNVNNLNSTKPVENGDRTSRGIKRPRVTSDEQPPSVHVIFNSLTRQSKKKLEVLLQQWSEWDAKHCSAQGSNEGLESGESTYYRALNVGLHKSSTVTFWLDNQTSKNKEGNGMDDGFVPVYDRGYALALTSGDGHSHLSGDSQLVDDSRCFNCGSYNHSLRECTKPRDNAAVRNARKQHKTKRNQNPNSRTPTRYYQNTPSGKYDGLKPGVLEAETRKLLGLGELDPPPWLDRMRELGYPPGYLADDMGEPSGLTIFGEEEIKEEEEKEDGEIQDMELSPPPELPTLPKKMSVDFPGINAPIPENADKRHWAMASSSADSYACRSSWRSDNPSYSTNRDQYRESRWSRDSRDDGLPGVDTSVYSYSSWHASYNPTDSFQSPRRDIHLSRSSSFERSERERSSRHCENSSYNPTENFLSPRRGSRHLSRSSSFERSEKDRSSRHQEDAQAHASYHSQNYASKSSHSASDDLRRFGDDSDRHIERSSRHGHREGRDNRYRRS